MKGYQKAQKTVKAQTAIGGAKGSATTHAQACTMPAIKVVDSEKLLEVLSDGVTAMIHSVGMEAVRQLMEEDVVQIVGPKSKRIKDRAASRHGYETTSIALADRKVHIKRPRVRSRGSEVPLPSLGYLQNEDPLNENVVARLLCGVSTRKFSRTVDQGDGDVSCVSKSDVARRYRATLAKLIDEFFDRPIVGDYPVIMVDGIVRGGMTVIVALGVSADGHKNVLGLVQGGTENSGAAKSLFSDLISRGLKQETLRLFVLDGSKALSKAVRDTFGDRAFIQRCQVHKKRNVLAHLPQSEAANVGFALSRAYMEFEHEEALRRLNAIAASLESRYPDAAKSLREGLDETLTVHRLRVTGLLRKTLSSTNAIESANSVAASVVRRIGKWQDGEMLLRNMAAGFIEAERGFRRVNGYKDLPQLEAMMCRERLGSDKPDALGKAS